MTQQPFHIVDIQAAPPLMLLPASLLGTMLLAYLIGSIPFGLILGKLYKIGDLRQMGSGNIGATNMLRAGGRKLAVATLALDMLKGVVAVLLCGAILSALLGDKFGQGKSIEIDVELFYGFFGLYAVIGHVWPIWLNYKGGKGVATALGALLAFAPLVGLLTIALWLMVFAITQYSSLSALVAIALSPLLCLALGVDKAMISAIVIALIVIYRHKENITRLMAGTEPKSDLSKKL